MTNIKYYYAIAACNLSKGVLHCPGGMILFVYIANNIGVYLATSQNPHWPFITLSRIDGALAECCGEWHVKRSLMR